MAPVFLSTLLSKHYGAARALDGVTLSIEPGEIVGLLGPNGSGKSTMLRLSLGFLKPTRGSVMISGYHCWRESVEVRRRVAYLPGELRLYDSMTGRQIVKFLAKLRGETLGTEVDQLARTLDIDIDRRLTELSSGMKRKIALLTVLIPRVPLIILDEPTNTLDPTMRDELMEQLLLAKVAGKAVLFSSHVLQEVESVCDRVAILKKGELVHEQSLGDLRFGRQVRAKLTGALPRVDPAGHELPAGAIVAGELNFAYDGPLPELLCWLGELTLTDLRIEPRGLGDTYRRFHG